MNNHNGRQFKVAVLRVPAIECLPDIITENCPRLSIYTYSYMRTLSLAVNGFAYTQHHVKVNTLQTHTITDTLTFNIVYVKLTCNREIISIRGRSFKYLFNIQCLSLQFMQLNRCIFEWSVSIVRVYLFHHFHQTCTLYFFWGKSSLVFEFKKFAVY